MTKKKIIVDDNPADQKLKTYIHIILDQSGSMDSIKNETISHFNEQVQEIKSKNTDNMETLVSFTVFNQDVTDKFLNKPVKSLKQISGKTYKPSGMTALFDAVGQSIKQLNSQPDIKDENTSVLVVILTDGWENASKTYSQGSVAAQIKELEDTKRWTFVYIGANQDLTAVSNNLNIPMANMLAYNADAKGVQHMSRRHSKGLGRYMLARSVGTSHVADFYSGSDEDDE